jgi:anti-sigma factor RsiW
MNCVELQQSLIEIEDARGKEQRAHLATCPECVSLLAELNLIASTAPTLRESDEPSPRVWNSIEIALRQEGLIHPPRASRPLGGSFAARWGYARWLVPAAAAILVAVGIYVRPQTPVEQLAKQITPQSYSDPNPAGLDDDELLQEVWDKSPATQAQYQDHLRLANEYIQDAKQDVASDPNDEEARRSLMEAYQQKAMLFDMAMDRSLP